MRNTGINTFGMSWKSFEDVVGDVYRTKCDKEKFVFISTNESSEKSFYYCKTIKTSFHVLSIPFEEQKLTMVLCGVDGTHCFPRKTSRDHEAEKLSSLLQNFSAKHNQPQPNLIQKRQKSLHPWHNSVELSWVDKNIQSLIRETFLQLQSTVTQYHFHFHQRRAMSSRIWTKFGCSDCERHRSRNYNKFPTNSSKILFHWQKF